MLYEDLRQWRDICEFFNQIKYKFIYSHALITRRYILLQPERKFRREELWSKYMIQICRFGPHPSAFYCYQGSRKNKDWGWQLLPDWEEKINFLEQIVLFDYNPDDLPQPWRRRIWEAFFSEERKRIRV
ncbi:MAG: hypothetical protein KME60_24185 [Cyanomargarita calcarea GSE-NOS-MK-12-04C]|jgi:hypothetical protein|uniref:Uncharacterized protein n=1 Tax=Cyanomargarita calcarea GSE-NOS-MK-12-04C TaxID=2839659 RepID=A0A951QR42_9CYAN|nr:hypothetical protein [Cyanomargarita calcarea GSE-NOS-MK-12-04C]